MMVRDELPEPFAMLMDSGEEFRSAAKRTIPIFGLLSRTEVTITNIATAAMEINRNLFINIAPVVLDANEDTLLDLVPCMNARYP